MRTQFQFLFGRLSTDFAQYILRWHYVIRSDPIRYTRFTCAQKL